MVSLPRTGGLLTVGLLCVTGVRGAQIWKFDFGPPDSPVWEGFQQVTHATRYSKAAGYGWLGAVGERRAETHRIRHGLQTTDPEDLTCDYVWTPVPFRVDVPPARYAVTVMVGTIGTYTYYPRQTYIVKAQGQPAVTVVIDGDNFYQDYYFRHTNWEFTPEVDIFDEMYRWRLREHTFEVDAPDGKIELQVSSAVPLLAALVYPAAERARMETDLAALNAARKQQFHDKTFAIRWPELNEAEPAATPADLKSGYVLFSRNIMEPVAPRSRPRPEELRPKTLSMFATPGEYESVSLSVYPLAELADATLALSGDLLSDDGRIPRSSVRVERVSYSVHGSRKTTLRRCGVVPRILRPAEPISIDPKWCVRYWVTIRVPDDVKPGVYQGTVRFSATGKPAGEVALKVRVLPFKLRDRPEILRGFFYYGPRYYRRLGYYEHAGVKEKYWASVERDLRLMKEYGFNTMDVRNMVRIEAENGRVNVDFSDVDRFYDLYKEVGLDGRAICSDGTVGTGPLKGQRPFGLPPALPYKNDGERELLKRTIRLFRDHALDAEWPGAPGPLLFWVTDEIANKGPVTVNRGIELLKIYRQIEGIRTYSSCNGPAAMRLLPWLDVISINHGVGINRETVERIRTSRPELGFYNLGGTRFAYGFYLWHTRGVIYLQWHWNSYKSDPFFALDGALPEFGYAYPTADGIFSTYQLELAREGVDDFRYLVTLESLLSEVRGVDTPEARKAVTAAEYALATFHQMTPTDVQRFNGPEKWDAGAYVRARALIVQTILSLKQAAAGPDRGDSSTERDAKPHGARQSQWWNAAFTYRMPVTVNAGGRSRRDAIVKTQLRPPVPGERVDPNSVRIVALDGGTPVEVPSVCRRGGTGTCQLMWQVRGLVQPLTPRTYHVYFDVERDGPGKAAPDYGRLEWADADDNGRNLVRNAGFEDPARKDPMLPEGWELEVTGEDTDGASAALVTDSVHSGRRAVRFDVEAVTSRVMLKQRIPAIKPNTRYRISMWARCPRCEDGRYVALATVWLYDAEGKPAARNCKIDTQLVGICDWTNPSQQTVAVGTVRLPETPANVAYGILGVGPYRCKATSYVDDIVLEPLEPEGAPEEMPIAFGDVERR